VQARFDHTEQGGLYFVQAVSFSTFSTGDGQFFQIGQHLFLQKDFILFSFFQQDIQGRVDLLKLVLFLIPILSLFPAMPAQPVYALLHR